MSKSLVTAITAAVALAVGSYAVAQEKQQVSRAAAKTLKAAQDACTAKKYDECVGKAKEALALPAKTGYDTYVSNQMLAFAYARQGNNAAAAAAMESQLDSGFASTAEKNTITKALASVAYQQKNYAKSIDMGKRLIAGGGADAETYTLIAQAYYLQEKYKDSAKFLSDYVAGQESRGQTPREQSLQLISDSYLKLGDNASSTATLEKLVQYYPKANYWNNLLYTMMRAPGITDRHTLHIYRLMQDTGTLKQASDYTEMAQIAIDQGTPGEAVSVLEAGVAANIFEEKAAKDRNQRLLDAAKKAATTDKASLTKFETEAKAAKTGEADVALGRGFLSYGMNDKAAEAIARGIAKGGVKAPDEAQILLGVAQLRLKNNAEAVKTFKAVKSTDEKFQRIAKLWALHAS